MALTEDSLKRLLESKVFIDGSISTIDSGDYDKKIDATAVRINNAKLDGRRTKRNYCLWGRIVNSTVMVRSYHG